MWKVSAEKYGQRCCRVKSVTASMFWSKMSAVMGWTAVSALRPRGRERSV